MCTVCRVPLKPVAHREIAGDCPGREGVVGIYSNNNAKNKIKYN